MGVGFNRKNEKDIVDFFKYSDAEIKALNKLTVTGNRHSLESRKYHHLCYLFELSYTICISLNNNICSNPGVDW